ncbi:hypothetical protein FI667_g4176, partial [Globisporangium splendens]
MVRRALAKNAPVLVFSVLFSGTAYAVFYAHYQQKTEKQVRLCALMCAACIHIVGSAIYQRHNMRNGVIRDIKRDRMKQREFEQQQQQQ